MDALEGTHETAEAAEVVRAIMLVSYTKSMFVSPEFIARETKGTELPRRCSACKNFKRISIQDGQFVFQGICMIEIILGKLCLHMDRTKWIAS
jgi:hypothetical protein